MKITSITVSAQRKYPHPTIDYANLGCFISLSADLGEEDNTAACAKKLQAQADNFVGQHVEAVGERLKQRGHGSAVAGKMQHATETKAATLAAKHGAKQ